MMFNKTPIKVYSPDNYVLIKGWRKPSGAKLCMFALCPQDHPSIKTYSKPVHVPLNAHDLQSIQALVIYLHVDTGFPVKSTWLTAIKSGKFTSWSGLAYVNASKYFPVSVDSIQCHLIQTRKGVRSTKPKPPSDTPLSAFKTH